MKNFLIYSALVSIAIFTACGKDDFDGSACISFTPASNIKVGDTITFTNCSTNSPYCAWNFGDNTNTTEKNPIHVYSAAGTYTVYLAVQDDVFKDINADMRINELDRYGNSDLISTNITVE